MSDLKQSHGVLWGRLAWHPAVKAWLAFAEGAGEPDTIEVLRDGKETAAHRLPPAPARCRAGGRGGGGGVAHGGARRGGGAVPGGGGGGGGGGRGGGGGPPPAV